MAAYTTINDPSAYFQTVLWSGDSSSPRTITFDGNSDLQPDWIWTKKRDGADHNQVYDSVRTFGAGKDLCSGQTFDEGNASNGSTELGFVSSATSDGFVVTAGNHGTASIRTLLQNITGKTYVGWGWKAGTSFTNDASSTGIGTIDSTGSVNDTAGFSIVSWTGTEANATVKHGLSSAPKAILIKCRATDSRSWVVYHDSIGNTHHLTLNETDASADSAASFNDTSPTTSVFSLGSSNNANASATMIAYCFAEKQGYSKFGSYTGNGNADGTFVYTGFKPAWLMYKASSISDQSWLIHDNKRGNQGSNANPQDLRLLANATNIEADVNIDFLSNGFKTRASDAHINSSGTTYIYMAFAENPFVTGASAVPTTAR
jgi:hypothetical protein